MGAACPEIHRLTYIKVVCFRESFLCIGKEGFIQHIFNMTPYAKPRFITDPEIIRKILDRCKIIHLGMQEDGHVYVVPTNYGYTYEDGKLTFYSHGAMEGKKWDIVKKNPEICVEIDTGFELVDSQDPCDYGNSYGSIIGTGLATIVEDLQEKKEMETAT